MKNKPLPPDPVNDCPVTHALSVIGGKWKPVILFCIDGGVDRFGASASAEELYEEFGLTAANVTRQAKAMLGRSDN